MKTGFIHSFESFGTKDGPGIRFILFVQGCPMRCLYCHNCDTWKIEDANREMTSQEVFDQIYKVRGFIKSGGVTASGGDPLTQPTFVKEIFQLCREHNIHTALDTTGYIFNSKTKDVLEYTDLVLLDIKHIDPIKYKILTAVDISPTLKFAEYLHEINKPVWLRYVLVPDYSDDEQDLHDWAKYCSKFTNVERVDILPFHQMGANKWEEMQREYQLKDVRTPTKEEVKNAEEIFKSYGLPVFQG